MLAKMSDTAGTGQDTAKTANNAEKIAPPALRYGLTLATTLLRFLPALVFSSRHRTWPVAPSPPTASRFFIATFLPFFISPPCSRRPQRFSFVSFLTHIHTLFDLAPVYPRGLSGPQQQRPRHTCFPGTVFQSLPLVFQSCVTQKRVWWWQQTD